MKAQCYVSALRGALPAFSILMLLGAACSSVPDAAPRDSEQPSFHSEEELGAVRRALTACGVSYFDAGGPEYEVVLACPCPSGHVRDFYAVWNENGGDCVALGWASAAASDCSVSVRITPDPFGSPGHCTIFSEAIRPHDSCVGACGGVAGSGCYCDSACSGFGDCCGDYARTCSPSDSCLSHCGGQAPAGCYCDEYCESQGDCCGDFGAVCPMY